jgi:hypothetical protein
MKYQIDKDFKLLHQVGDDLIFQLYIPNHNNVIFGVTNLRIVDKNDDFITGPDQVPEDEKLFFKYDFSVIDDKYLEDGDFKTIMSDVLESYFTFIMDEMMKGSDNYEFKPVTDAFGA